MSSTRFVAGLLALSCLCSGAYAALSGAYLGCFTATSAELQSGVEQVVALSTGMAAAQACWAKCYAAHHSLAILSSDFKCRCGLQAPPTTTRLADTACNAGGAGMAVFHLHDDTGAVPSPDACSWRVVDLPLVPSNMVPAYNPDHVGFSAGTMTLALDGSQGTRVASKGMDFLYGSFQVKAAIPCGSGVISSFYLRSSDEYADLNAGVAAAGGDFSELDFEFISHNGKPCSTWLNTFVGGKTVGELQMTKAEANGVAPSEWATYTMYWQPSFVTWAVNGLPIKTYATGDATTFYGSQKAVWAAPNQRMHPAFTMWTDSRPVDAFGGTIDASKGPYKASFNTMRMVVCASGSSRARGPAWLQA